MFFFRALGISVVFHILLTFFILKASHFFPYENESTFQRIEIIFNQEESRPKTFVRETEIPNDLKAAESSQQPRFASLREKRVLQETRAELSGLTKNRSQELEKQLPKISDSTSSSKEISKKQDIQPPPKEDESLLSNNFRKRLMPRFEPQPIQISRGLFEAGISTVGESLPNEIKIGSFTALNTDRHLYYSFFSRVEELIRFRWVQNVESHIDYLGLWGYRGVRQNQWITQVTILLNSKGEFEEASLEKNSGMIGFDKAAIEAFRSAYFFPNPPLEMIDRDGKIRLKYAFLVQWSPVLRN